MSIEIDDETMSIIAELQEEKMRLTKRISYLEGVLSQIEMFNALGKTLRISEAIHSAINP